MHPFFHFIIWDIPAYWLMGVIGVAAASLFVLLRNRRFKMPGEDVLHIGLLIAVGAVVGSKLLFLITILPTLIRYADVIFTSPEGWAMLVQGGYVFYGGLLGGAAAAVIYCRKYKVSVSEAAALITPAIPLFHAFGRVGCFLAGCCWGIEVPWGIVYTESLGAPNGVPLLPIQLIEAGLNLCLFIGLWLYQNHRARTAPIDAWQPLPVYILLYAVLRFTLEFFRGDAERGVALLSTSQWVSLVLVLAVCGWYIFRRKKAGRQTPAAA